ncbi:hypothetical protein ACFLUO_01010 [Chloroflexota bacterium]
MVKEYIFLAAGCVSVGVVIAFIVLGVSQRMGMNIMGESLWVLGIPAVLSVTLNVLLLELYRKLRKKKG